MSVEYRPMNPFDPRITVATIVEDQGQFLLVQEWQDDQLVLNQPAGHVEAQETLAEAAIRETREETAWLVEPTAYLGVYVYQPEATAGVYFRHCFIARPLEQLADQLLDDGIEGATWLTADAIRERHAEHRSPLIQQCLDDYLSGRRLPLESIYQHPWPA